MKRLVVYYSFEGNTKESAERIAKGLKADICRVIPVKDIPIAAPGKFLAGGFQAMIGRKAPIKPLSSDLNDYDEIIIGTPVWAGFCAPFINTIIKDESVRNKVTSVFTLSGSGNNSRCIKSLKKRLPNLKNCVSLIDRVGKGAADNKKKTEGFVAEIIGVTN